MAILKRLTVAVTFALVSVGLVVGQVDEYRVKAFFLCNFARYVAWPAEVFKGTDDPIVICVLGKNPFNNALEQAVSGITVDGRKLAVHQVQEVARGCNCHMLFVSAAEWKRFRASLEALKGSGVLTIGEAPGFASGGGVINLKLEDGKVHFEINVESVGTERLRISSKLLSLAQIVRK